MLKRQRREWTRAHAPGQHCSCLDLAERLTASGPILQTWRTQEVRGWHVLRSGDIWLLRSASGGRRRPTGSSVQDAIRYRTDAANPRGSWWHVLRSGDVRLLRSASGGRRRPGGSSVQDAIRYRTDEANPRGPWWHVFPCAPMGAHQHPSPRNMPTTPLAARSLRRSVTASSSPEMRTPRAPPLTGAPRAFAYSI